MILVSIQAFTEVNTLRQGVYANSASLHPGASTFTWSVVMNNDHEHGVESKEQSLADGRLETSMITSRLLLSII